ncbi:class I SAM-dependent methyltransferase [Conexibacter woesei]|uniref:class I SAM-dependent methyltransferase n=1 Tax=Conexibacter woesei TaxID=191495 RepID=UPI0004081EEC|nr:class I SAM-dependent methyltransferase [Conexibacter woesei]
MSIKDQARNVAIERLRKLLPQAAPELELLGQNFPHGFTRDSWSRPLPLGAIPTDGDLPLPPEELWAYYCTGAESWLDSGRRDVATMRDELTASGAPIEEMGRVLEVGSASGRMIRHLEDVALGGVEVWGVDIWSTAVLWCQDNLSPRFRFATTTLIPHLPFPDGHFDLIYGGSLFTHIDDLAEAWFLEMHRVLAPGGRLYFSINDHSSVEIFEGRGPADRYEEFYERTGGQAEWESFVRLIQGNADYQRFRRREAYMFTQGKMMRHVMWDTDVLTRRLDWGYKPHSITPMGYGHQSTVLLEAVPFGSGAEGATSAGAGVAASS